MKIHAAPLPRRKHRNRCLSVVQSIIWLFCLVAGTVWVWMFMRQSDVFSYDISCQSDGTVWIPWANEFTKDKSLAPPQWTLDQTLSIPYGFGSFTFAQAKAIDVSFHLVIGWGGQLLMAFACYPIFRKSFARVMEIRRVTIPEFTAVAFSQVSLAACWTFGCGFVSACWPRRRRATLDWRIALMFFAFTYILTFPTWIEAMTGYQTAVVPYVVNPDNQNLVPTSGWLFPDLVIRDGSRIGLEDNHTVKGTSYYEGNSYYDTLSACFIGLRDTAIPIDTEEFTFWTKFEAACTFWLDPNATSIDNSTAFVFYTSQYYNHVDTHPPIKGPLLTVEPVEPGPSNDYISFGSLKLDRAYVSTHTSCQPGQSYQWGASQNLLLLFTLWTSVFAVLMTALQQDAYWNSRCVKYESTTNQSRDALDLAVELKEQFGNAAEEMSAKELKRLIANEPGGVGIETDGLLLSKSEESRLRWRRRKEKWRSGRSPDSRASAVEMEEGQSKEVKVTEEELASSASSMSTRR